MKKLAYETVWHVALLSLSVGFVLAVQAVDRSFPVVKDFKVTSMKARGTSVVIEGTLNKVRDCKFIEITAYTTDGRRLGLVLTDRPPHEPAVTRPLGPQLWGPWEVYPQGYANVDLYVHHACSIFWSQTSKLTALTLLKVDRIPGK